MTPLRLFILNGLIAAGYGIALLVGTGPILDLYGISPSPEASFMARWFGLGLLANGLITWLAREAAESDAGRAISFALTITYGFGVVLALLGTLFGPFNALGWIAVGLNLLLALGFGYARFMRAQVS
jgi:hypothetical protein